jgi:glycosyltransferase involved in cell wall biosynthesis
MKNLHLAVFNTQPPLFLGGVERRILETAKRIQTEVDTAVYSGTKAGLRRPVRLDGLTVIPCLCTDKAFPLDNWTFNQTLARNAADFKADVYEAHTASAYALLNALRKRGGKSPFIQTVHGVLADEYVQAAARGSLSLRGKVANLLMWQLAKHEYEAAKKATLVVTISQYSVGKIRQYYPDVDPGKVRVVPNGVDTQRFQPNGDSSEASRRIHAAGRQVVLFVGRLIPRKGLTYLIEAAKAVVKERGETLFVLVGNGPQRAALETEAAKANLTRNFLFLGDVSEALLPQIYRCADVFALPSIQEGQGIVLLEAQATAVPVVAFRVSGVTEAVVDGKTGLLVKPAESAALAQALLKLLVDAALRQKMGVKGREFVQAHLTWEITARKMLTAYREAIQLAKY